MQHLAPIFSIYRDPKSPVGFLPYFHPFILWCCQYMMSWVFLAVTSHKLSPVAHSSPAQTHHRGSLSVWPKKDSLRRIPNVRNSGEYDQKLWTNTPRGSNSMNKLVQDGSQIFECCYCKIFSLPRWICSHFLGIIATIILKIYGNWAIRNIWCLLSVLCLFLLLQPFYLL